MLLLRTASGPASPPSRGRRNDVCTCDCTPAPGRVSTAAYGMNSGPLSTYCSRNERMASMAFSFQVVQPR
jgi:hypothetical protein